ncbi:hypothetical protein B0O80DRAFT_435173 [Mortierella sp. GBAus27b]|nr:hypothetical protein B0O80DRAFT_435173 [Mortierella sp. GBAus27b]
MSWRAELSRNDPIHQQMTKLIQRDQWPCLETLNIAIDFEDTVLAAIIERAGNPSEIILTARLFGNHSFKQLGYHFGNLMHLDLWSCLPTSSMVRNILSGCPRLKTLKAGNIYARDIAQGRLCCLQLRELKICIVIEKSEQDLHRVIFERLSTLVHLEHLQLGYPGENELGNHHGLQFRLDLGMGQLRSLRQLKGVSFVNDIPACRLHPQIGKEEAEWIVENWKNLKRIKGELNSDKAEDRRSKDLLAQHGIDVAGPGAPSSSDSE